MMMLLLLLLLLLHGTLQRIIIVNIVDVHHVAGVRIGGRGR